MAQACSKFPTGCISAIAGNLGFWIWFPSKLDGVLLHTCHIFSVDTEVLTTNNDFSSRRAFCGRNPSHHWRWSHRYIYIFISTQEITSLSFLHRIRLRRAAMFVSRNTETCAQISSWLWHIERVSISQERVKRLPIKFKWPMRKSC